ncbi:MAG: 1-phosphofructokinase [Butyrivibrio sp.]|nr:1-phosphofructokinase [Muribaculum sp.]MCM1552553.1 1-phosphofructokinase [Butyrivibrio sp.]
MIYTVTFNPSLDYIVSVEHLTLGAVNRTSRELMNPGGKGVNVSIVLRNLGCESTALGFSAGFTGREIVRLMKEQRIESDFIEVGRGLSRINVKIRSDEESEINGMGPEIDSSDIGKLYARLDRLKEGDVLVLAGSIPSVMPDTMYSDIMRHLSGRGLRIVVDATKDLLVNVLQYHPFLVKPNNHELGEIYGVTLNTREEVIPYAKRLHEEGAGNVLVSMAGEGAVLITDTGAVYQSEAPKGKVENSVGAGDSMVAGFLAGYLASQDYEQAFYMGICAGSASAFSEGMATREAVCELLKQFGKEQV